MQRHAAAVFKATKLKFSFIDSFGVCKFIFWKFIARLNQVDIKDAAEFVEGMRHNTHLTVKDSRWYAP